MKLSKRGKRRILIVCGIAAVLVVGLVTLVLVRGTAQDHRIADAREEGLAAHAAGDYETALRLLSVYLSSNRTDVEALVAFADTRSKIPVENNRHVLEAIGLFHAALEREPDNFKAMSGLLHMYERTRRRVELRELAERMLSIEPNDIDALRLRGFTAYREGDYELAMEDSNRLIELQPDRVEWRNLYLQVLRAQNRPLNELLEVCQQWDEAFDGDGRYRLMMAQLHAVSGDTETARATAREAAQRGASEVDVLRQMVNMLDAMRLRDEATALILATQENHPDELWPYEAQVRRSWQGNRLSDALSVIEDLEADGVEIDQDLRQWQALVLLMLNRHDQARDVAAQLEAGLVDYQGDDRDARQGWFQAIRARLNAGSVPWRETRNAYQMAVSLAPRDAVLPYLLGEAYMEVGEYELAFRALEQAQQSDPHWLGAHVAYVEALLMAGQVERALEAAQSLVQRVETPGLTAYTLLARAWLDAGRPNQSIGLTDQRTGRPVTMLDFLQRLYESHAQEEIVSVLLARAAAQYDTPHLAEHVFEDAMGNPESRESTLRSLASISHRHDLGYARRLLDHAVEVHGLSIETAESLAYLKHELGESDQGLAILREAMGQHEDNARVRRIHAGYLATINHNDAIGALRRTLEDDSHTAASFVLGHEVAWTDRELTKEAIDLLADAVGADSPRVAVARAHYVLRHDADSEAALADAQVSLGEVLQRVPDSLSALNLMAHLALQGERPNEDRAIRHLQTAIRYYPHNADLYLRLIPLLQSRGDFASANEYLARVRSVVADDPRVRQAELDLWRTQGNFEQVIARMGEMIDATSSESERLIYAANLHRAGHRSEADRVLSDLLDDPDHTEATVLIAAQFYADTGRFDQAIDLVRQSTVIDSPHAEALIIGRVYHHAGRPGEASAYYEQVLENDPNNLEAMSLLIEVSLALGENRRAYTLSRRGLELDPANESLRSSVVLSAMQLGDREQQQAMRILSELETEASAMSRTLQIFARISGSNDELSVSRQDLLDLRELTLDFPLYMPAWRLAILAHVQGDEVEEAVRLARQATARLPHLPDPAEMGTHLLVQTGRLNEALEMGRTWRQRSLDRPMNADLLLAAVYTDLGRAEDAVRQLQPHLQRMINERTAHPERLSLWLQAVLHAGQLQDAADQFRGVFDESGDWQHVWMETSRVLERRDAAAFALEVAGEHGGEDPTWQLSLASAWSQMAQRFDDDAAFAKADGLAADAGNAQQDLKLPSLIIRAQNADWSDNDSAAEDYYRQALSLDREHPIVLNNLASLLNRNQTQCQEAAELAAKAVQIAPDIPEIRNTYAQAQLCLDDPEAAERLSREALQVRPDSPEFLVTLGLALAAQQAWDEAAEALVRIDDLVTEQGEPNSRTFRQRVDHLRTMLTERTALR